MLILLNPHPPGAASGIGASAVECFAAAGAKVIYAADIKAPTNLLETKAKGYESEVVGVACDITKEEQVKELVTRVIKEHGRLDWFVSSTGARSKTLPLTRSPVRQRRHRRL